MVGIELRFEFAGFADRFQAFVKLAAQKIRQRMRDRMTGSRTGRLYRRSGNSGFARMHRASAPGESPANDTGAYSRSLAVLMRSSLEAQIVTNLGYPAVLERMNRPLARPSVDETLPDLAHDLTRILNQR